MSELSRFARVPRPRGRNLCGIELEQLVRELANQPELWIERIKHDHTQRTYEELFSDDYVTAWLICWMQDHDTGFHDHDVSYGAVSVLSGRVREERLQLDGAPIAEVYAAGESFHFSPADIHRVRHAGDAPAVTLHVYSPPLLSMGAYVVDDHGRLLRRAIPASEELRPLEEQPEPGPSPTAGVGSAASV
ncbi:MAG TPA: cysteine dioxygenase family protein [Solirubrobacteraceae bacterium]|nr:cysteine dioxygenase family protein [Solirubrobacteraceae bacterium]